MSSGNFVLPRCNNGTTLFDTCMDISSLTHIMLEFMVQSRVLVVGSHS